MVARVLQGIGESAEAVVFAMLRDLDESVKGLLEDFLIFSWAFGTL